MAPNSVYVLSPRCLCVLKPHSVTDVVDVFMRLQFLSLCVFLHFCVCVTDVVDLLVSLQFLSLCVFHHLCVCVHA